MEAFLRAAGDRPTPGGYQFEISASAFSWALLEEDNLRPL
jgi:hypothetical protein